MRLKKSFLNAFTNSLILIIRSVLLFVVRIVFVKTLGKTLLGVDSLFTNIVLVLSLADSGIGTAINFSLYKPLAEKNYQKVSTLMSFYKKVYRNLGIIVFIIGILFMPFLPFIVSENIDHIYLYYFLYVATTVISYFLSYKDSLLNADQNSYKSSIIVGSTYVFMYVLRIIFLLLIPSFFIYIMIQLIITFIQRLIINRYITKQYPYISFSDNRKIEKKEQKDIFKRIKSMFINKVGYFLVNSTDNIIISAIPGLGLGMVAVYTNYYSVTNMVDSIVNRGLSGITASFGNLAVSESKKTQENVFNIMMFLSFIIYGLISIGFLFLLTPFIKICFGPSFELNKLLTLIICINFYIIGMIKTLDIVKEATGNYIKDRYANIIQAIINLFLSTILGIKFGLIGIVIATLISYIIVPLWNKPYIVYRYIFEKKAISYFIRQLVYFISLIIITIICSYVLNLVIINNIIIDFIIKGLIICIIYLIVISIIYYNTDEYKYIFNLIKKVKLKRK